MTRTNAEEARDWLIAKAGFHKATQMIRDEARQLRIDPTSDQALRNALVTYEAESGVAYPRWKSHHHHWQQPDEQGKLL